MAENSNALHKFDVAYFTASTDTFDGEKGNKAFAESLKADYPILSDPDGSTAKAYGVYNDKSQLRQSRNVLHRPRRQDRRHRRQNQHPERRRRRGQQTERNGRAGKKVRFINRL